MAYGSGDLRYHYRNFSYVPATCVYATHVYAVARSVRAHETRWDGHAQFPPCATTLLLVLLCFVPRACLSLFDR